MNLSELVNQIDWLCWGLLWVILSRLPKKGREIIEMKERGSEERETGMKEKKQMK